MDIGNVQYEAKPGAPYKPRKMRRSWANKISDWTGGKLSEEVANILLLILAVLIFASSYFVYQWFTPHKQMPAVITPDYPGFNM